MQIKPPVLFRVASKQSRGTNSAIEIDPLSGYDAEYHDSVDAIDYHRLREMVHDHVKYNYDAPSEFSSWSVSLLYVLVHAVRKLYYFEDDLLVYVMDTRKLPTKRVHSSTDLIHQLGVDWARNIVDYSLGEYLVHGKLELTPGLWQAVKFERLISAGFWEALPFPQNERYLLTSAWSSCAPCSSAMRQESRWTI